MPDWALLGLSKLVQLTFSAIIPAHLLTTPRRVWTTTLYCPHVTLCLIERAILAPSLTVSTPHHTLTQSYPGPSRSHHRQCELHPPLTPHHHRPFSYLPPGKSDILFHIDTALDWSTLAPHPTVLPTNLTPRTGTIHDLDSMSYNPTLAPHCPWTLYSGHNPYSDHLFLDWWKK